MLGTLPAETLAGEHTFDQLLAGLLLVDKRGAQRALPLNVVLSCPEADAAWLATGAGRRQAERRIKQLDIVRTLGSPQLKKISIYLAERVPSDPRKDYRTDGLALVAQPLPFGARVICIK
jgi:hypothetical protein